MAGYDLAKTRDNMACARVNLCNAGLADSGCVAAYMAALYVGASAEEAFEAARRHQLLMTPEDTWGAHTQRRYQYPDEYREMLQRQRGRIDRIRTLPNPFAVEVEIDRPAAA